MTVRVTIVRRTIRVSLPRSVPASVQAWLDSLDPYDSDESAADAGVPIGDWYMRAFNHVEGGGGSPKKRLV